MINKALRILIADGCYPQSLSIEKMLNRIGYYCASPACSFVEVETLSGYANASFDLLVINANLLYPNKGQLCLVWLEQAKVKNIIIYGVKSLSVEFTGLNAGALNHQLCVIAGLPEYGELKKKMASIDQFTLADNCHYCPA